MGKTAAKPVAAGPRLWTRAEFYRMADLGFFDGQKAERLEGQIVVQSPQNWPHTSGITRTYNAVLPLYTPGFWVRIQFPLELGQTSDPEPDVSVVVGSFEDYAGHPTAAVLVVEVSDSTLHTDRGPKLRTYAAAGVPEYWIVNLADDQIEVYTDPVQRPARQGGARYRQQITYIRGDVIPLRSGTVPAVALLG